LLLFLFLFLLFFLYRGSVASMDKTGASDIDVVTLDPYQCIAKRNRKYASECTEVHLGNLGAEAFSENFQHFGNLEVVWFNDNRLSRIENLDSNFRIREVFIQNNRLVSLAGLHSFKFLKVLLASGNQLRNLEKQLALLSRFAFLKHLDLFDNPVAEEPDYRLRLIYHLPQVEILDRKLVKDPERIRADEVVPNLDKVAAKAEKPPPKGPEHSLLERSCINTARMIRERKRREEDTLMGQTFRVTWNQEALPPEARLVDKNREHWSDPRRKVDHELTRPTAWERMEMKPLIEKRSGKAQLTKVEVELLAEDLVSNGLEEVGRTLKAGNVFASAAEDVGAPLQSSALSRSLKALNARHGEVQGDPHPLDKLLQDDAATMPVGDVASWLLQLEWPRLDDDFLDRRIAKLYEDAQRAEFAGDMATLEKHRTAVMRLEGAKTRKHHVELNRKDTGKALQKARRDIFPQSLLKTQRQVDEATGRVVLKVSLNGRSTSFGDRREGY